jgi:hypothetical protein
MHAKACLRLFSLRQKGSKYVRCLSADSKKNVIVQTQGATFFRFKTGKSYQEDLFSPTPRAVKLACHSKIVV